MDEDEMKRQVIRDWLADLEHGERVRILQFFALQFGVEIPAAEIMSRRIPDGLQLHPPETVKETASGI
jgi:hypothetical protein